MRPNVISMWYEKMDNLSRGSEILTLAEAAVLLRCSKAHVCNAINGKVRGVAPLPAISMGRRKLIRRAALESWLKDNESGTPSR